MSVDGTLAKLSRIPGESDDEPMYFDVESGLSPKVIEHASDIRTAVNKVGRGDPSLGKSCW